MDEPLAFDYELIVTLKDVQDSHSTQAVTVEQLTQAFTHDGQADVRRFDVLDGIRRLRDLKWVEMTGNEMRYTPLGEEAARRFRAGA